MFSLHVHTHSPMCYDYMTAADNTCVCVIESWSQLLESGWGTGIPGLSCQLLEHVACVCVGCVAQQQPLVRPVCV